MAHVNCKFLHLAFKIVSSAIIFIFHLNDKKIRNCKFQTNNERFNTYFNLQEQQPHGRCFRMLASPSASNI